MSITLHCVSQGGKLRVKFESYTDTDGKVYNNAYDPTFNCQFPKAIRKIGARYSIPESDLTLVLRAGKPFYRIGYNNITILNSNGSGEDVLHTTKVVGKKRKSKKDKAELNEQLEPVKNIVMPANIYEIKECVICLESESNRIIVPCGHLCMCNNCSSASVKLCPLCRVQITSTINR